MKRNDIKTNRQNIPTDKNQNEIDIEMVTVGDSGAMGFSNECIRPNGE